MSHESSVCRDCKGESMLIPLDEYVVIDLETTGFSPLSDTIIEFAAARVRNHQVVDTFSTLANPGCKLHPNITALTGITNAMLEKAPDLRIALGNFLSFVSKTPVVGHNVGFDINFLYDQSVINYGHGFENDYVDTLRLARRCAPHLEHHKLATLSKYYDIPNDQAHRALSDVLCTQQLYETFNKYYFMGEYLPESRAFGSYSADAIYDSITDMVDDRDNVELKRNKSSTVIKMYGSVVFEVRLNSVNRVLVTDHPAADKFIPSIPNARTTLVGLHHIPVASTRENVPLIKDMVLAIYKACQSSVTGDTFGCCNDFVRCSDARRCLHIGNTEYNGCLYRRNLENGKIFYGKNKNI